MPGLVNSTMGFENDITQFETSQLLERVIVVVLYMTLTETLLVLQLKDLM